MKARQHPRTFGVGGTCTFPAFATARSCEESGLTSLTTPAGTTVNLFDLYAFNTNIIANAGAYGITDTTDRCFTNTPISPEATPACGVDGANVGQYFHRDSIHPTGKVQALAGNAMAAAPRVVPSRRGCSPKRVVTAHPIAVRSRAADRSANDDRRVDDRLEQIRSKVSA